MCGRVVVKELRGSLVARLQGGPPAGLVPSFNIPPTGLLVTVAAAAGGWTAALRRWGLVPAWARDPALGAKLFNARAETVAEKPSFRAAFRSRRCLVPVDGFYEWRPEGKAKAPWFISGADPAEMLVFAGLFETWGPPGAELATCTILTTEANAFMRRLHGRMPAVLAPGDWAAWLAPGTAVPDLQALLRPAPEEALQAWPVRPLRGDGPGLVAPLAP